jgi:hypothetical protein
MGGRRIGTVGQATERVERLDPAGFRPAHPIERAGASTNCEPGPHAAAGGVIKRRVAPHFEKNVVNEVFRVARGPEHSKRYRLNEPAVPVEYLPERHAIASRRRDHELGVGANALRLGGCAVS